MRGKHLRGLRCALVLACARALYEEAASIETLADFKSVLASNETWLVHFCVPDVEGCEVFAPGFAPIAEEIVQFGIRVGFVEPSEKNQKMFAGMGVQRVPALKGFFGPTSINPYTKKPHRDSTDYDFGTSMRPASVKRWAYKHMPHAVHQKATGKTLSPLFGAAVAGGGEVAVFFTDRDDTSPLLKALSNEFAGRLTIAEVHSSETELTEAYGVTAFPELHVVAPPRPALIDGDVTEGGIAKYDGSLRDRAALTAFLEAHALAEAVGGGGGGGDDGGGGGDDAGAGGGGDAAEEAAFLSADEFSSTVLAATDAWILALVRDADDNALPQDYAAVAPKAEGSLHAGALRCTEHEAVCAAHADAKWLVYAYSSAEGKKPPPTTAASAAAALRDATETVPDRAVRDLGPAQIDSIMSQAADEGASRHPRDLPSLGANSRALASHAFLALAQAKSFFSPSQRRPSRRSCSSRSA